MAFKLNLFCLVFVLVVWQQASTMRIQIETQKYDGIIPESFKITCAPEGTNICSKKILAIQVSKNSNNPIVTLQQPSDILYDKLLAANVKAEGLIHKDIHKTQLTVTITNVLTEDSGMYTCTMIYLDPSGILLQDSTSENYIVESQNAHSLVRYLMAEVSSVKTLLHHQQNNTGALELQLNQQSRELEKLKSQTREGIRSAFQAGFNGGYRSEKQIMLFSEVKMNVGEDFDTSTSVYTAPVDGLYAFHLLARASKTNHNFELEIRVNEITNSRMYGYDKDSYTQNSMSIVANLKEGDRVDCFFLHTIPHSNYMPMHAFPYTYFSGYLIHPM